METTDYSKTMTLLKKAERVLVFLNNRSSLDTHYAVAALKKVLESEGKSVTVVANGDLILKHRLMFEREGVDFSLDIQPLSYVITIDHTSTGIEKVSYDDKDGKFRLYITPVSGEKEFDFKKVQYTQGGGEADLIVVFGCRSLKWLNTLYDSNKELFSKVPIININNLQGEQEFGTSRIVDERVAVSELVLNVLGITQLKKVKQSANLLLRGIIDHFQPLQLNVYPSTALAKIAELVSLGADMKEAFKKLYFEHTYENFELQRKVMSNFQFDRANGIAWSSVSSLDLNQCGVDRDTFILDGRIIFNICTEFKVAFVLYEVQNGEIVVELEVNNARVDARELLPDYKVAGTHARIFFTVRDKNLAEVEESVIKAISRNIGLWDIEPEESKDNIDDDRVENNMVDRALLPSKSENNDAEPAVKSAEQPAESNNIRQSSPSAVSSGLVPPPPISAEDM